VVNVSESSEQCVLPFKRQYLLDRLISSHYRVSMFTRSIATVPTGKRVLHTSSRLQLPRVRPEKSNLDSSLSICPNLDSIASSVRRASKSTTPVAPELRALLSHVLTSLMHKPAKQRIGRKVTVSITPHSPPMIKSSSPGVSRSTSVLALINPYEGGDVYISDAIEQVAGAAGADLVRIDLPLSVGLSGEVTMGE
jgi:hypothetical protein